MVAAPDKLVAKLEDPKVAGGKIGFVNTPGPVKGVCAITGVEVTYEKDPLYPVAAVVVNMSAARSAGWLDSPLFAVIEEEQSETVDTPSAPSQKRTPPKSKKPKTCPECGGKRRGRGYIHGTGCSLDSRLQMTKGKSK